LFLWYWFRSQFHATNGKLGRRFEQVQGESLVVAVLCTLVSELGLLQSLQVAGRQPSSFAQVISTRFEQ